MKQIYLDFNIFLSILKKENNYEYTLSKINQLQKNEFIFPYSPAHIEEVAVNYKRNIDNKEEEVNKHLLLIERISKNYEYLPGIPSLEKIKSNIEIFKKDSKLIKEYETYKFIEQLYNNNEISTEQNKTILKKEIPKDCLQRVMDGIDSTDYAIKNEQFNLGRRNPDSLKNNFTNLDLKDLIPNTETFLELRKKYKIDINSFDKYDYSNIFEHSGVEEMLIIKLNENNLSLNNLPKNIELINNHAIREEIFTIFLNILEIVGFFQEKNNKYTTLRSRMHDVTHAIYGAQANYFITNDNRFYNKVKAIYYYLEINTTVLTLNEFINFDF